MKIVVDFDKCASNARCMKAAPEVFEVREDGFLYILQEDPPESLRSKTWSAHVPSATASASGTTS